MHFTNERMDYGRIRVGDTVSGDVVEWGMNDLPPISSSSRCSQVGEPIASFPDDNGKWRETFFTFELVNLGGSSSPWDKRATWRFCGCCFAYETTNRYGWYELYHATRGNSCDWYIRNVINR